MHVLMMLVALCGQAQSDQPEKPNLSQPPEKLSAVYQATVRRLDGRTASCLVQTVLSGHPMRVGKSIVVREFVGDPWGFLSWLNGVRLQAGLAMVSYDTNLSAWAELNNPPQLEARASGHHVLSNASQVAFYGPTNAVDAGNGFLASPAHRQVLLDPLVRTVGIAASTDHRGWAWTVNAQR